MMTTPTTSDYKVLDIDEHAARPEPKGADASSGGHPSSAPNDQQHDDPALKLVHTMSSNLKDCLHCCDDTFDKGPVDHDKSEEDKTRRQAYRKLMEDLEGEKQERPFSAVMWIINGCVLLMFIIFLATTRGVHAIHVHRLLHLRIHRWVALVMVVVCGCPCIRFVTYIVSEPFVWIWKMKYRYLIFYARELKRSVDVTLWFVLALWVWYTWFRPEIIKDTYGASVLHVSLEDYKHVVKIVVKQITRLLLALTIGAVIWTVKSVAFLKLLADLHFKELCDRIGRTILDLHGIQFIEIRKQWSFLIGTHKTPNANAGTTRQAKAMSFWYNVSQLKKETVPIWILKRLTYTYMQHMRKKPAFLDRLKDTNDDKKLMDVAKEMFYDVVGIDKSHLDRYDLDSYDIITREHLKKYGLEMKEEVDRVFKLFAPKEDKTDEITRDQFLRWAVRAVKNCLGLERTIESSKRIFWKLNILMSSGVVVITLVIWLLLTEIVTTSQIAILFAPFLSASFIFGESLKRSFDGIMFVFGMHPFDVGDRVMIQDVEMKVDEMNILSTVFIKYDTGVEAIYPNSTLATIPVINLDTAPDQPDIIEFTVPLETRQELIHDLKIKITKSLDDDLTYTSSTVVAKKEISNTDLTLIVYFKYLVPYLSAEAKAQHRSKILCKIIKMRNEMKTAQEEANKPGSEEAHAILRLTIDVKEKLPKIEGYKKMIMEILMSLESLRGSPQVLFTGIYEDNIAMDFRMRHTKDLSKDELKTQIENAIKTKDENSEQRNKKKVVEWLPKADWDDEC